MKKLTMAALVAGQLSIAAQPAIAADLTENRSQQMGAFAGFRMRVPLDGNAQERRIRAGLAVAPSMHSRAMNRPSRLAIGEGLELGIVGRQPVRLMLGGQDIRRLGAGQDSESGEGEEHHGPSTLGWIAIGVGALVVVTATAGFFVVQDIIDCDDGEDCT